MSFRPKDTLRKLADAGADPGVRLRAHPVHAGSDARRYHGNERLQPAAQRIHAGERAHLYDVSAGG